MQEDDEERQVEASHFMSVVSLAGTVSIKLQSELFDYNLNKLKDWKMMRKDN